MSRGVVMVADKLIEFLNRILRPLDSAQKLRVRSHRGASWPHARAKTISESSVFMECLKKHAGAGKLYGAICAAPAVVLQAHGLIPEGAPATCYPAFAEKLDAATRSEERVVVAGKLVTSRGPGTAIEFALALIEQLMDKLDAEKAKGVAKGDAGHGRGVTTESRYRSMRGVIEGINKDCGLF